MTSAPPRSGSAAPADTLADLGAREAFLALPVGERRRRLRAFRDALAPALDGYSVDDYLAEKRREAARED